MFLNFLFVMFGYLCVSLGAYECCAHSCLEIVAEPLELNLKAIVKCPMWIPDLFLISELCIQPQMQNKFENNPEKQKMKRWWTCLQKGGPFCRRKQNHVESGNVKSAQAPGSAYWMNTNKVTIAITIECKFVVCKF